MRERTRLENELEILRENERAPLYEREFDSKAPPRDVADALVASNVPLALKLAMQAGARDENDLTNLIFFARRPELTFGKLAPKDRNFKKLSAEWARIRK